MKPLCYKSGDECKCFRRHLFGYAHQKWIKKSSHNICKRGTDCRFYDCPFKHSKNEVFKESERQIYKMGMINHYRPSFDQKPFHQEFQRKSPDLVDDVLGVIFDFVIDHRYSMIKSIRSISQKWHRKYEGGIECINMGGVLAYKVYTELSCRFDLMKIGCNFNEIFSDPTKFSSDHLLSKYFIENGGIIPIVALRITSELLSSWKRQLYDSTGYFKLHNGFGHMGVKNINMIEKYIDLDKLYIFVQTYSEFKNCRETVHRRFVGNFVKVLHELLINSDRYRRKCYPDTHEWIRKVDMLYKL